MYNYSTAIFLILIEKNLTDFLGEFNSTLQEGHTYSRNIFFSRHYALCSGGLSLGLEMKSSGGLK